MRIQQLGDHDLVRVHEIDVSESHNVIYRYTDGVLQTTVEQWTRPQWTQEEWQHQLQHWIADLHPDRFLKRLSMNGWLAWPPCVTG
ncbi:MAG: hypothetical protein R2932_06290 [Caldilineaceae bacterium]